MFDGPADVARTLGWLDDLIECTCPLPPVLVGETLGAAIAARFAIEHSERIAELVLVDALGLTSFNPTPEFGRALQAFIAAPGETTHDDLWSLCAFDLVPLRRQLGERWELIKAYNLELARTPVAREAMDQLMGQFGIRAISNADLARIGVPTALIWGRQDRVTPVRVAEEAAARFGWPLTVIDNAGDAPDFEQPGAFVKALRSVLGAPKIQQAAL
jgi:pimeloyl-ACP methyl ester carboxylesterase